MNILYILQQSIYNKKNKWLTADSNVNMMAGMLRQVTRLRPDWNFYILIGKLKDFADITSYDEIFNHPNVHFIEYDFPVDAFLNRQHFDVKKFHTMWKKLPEINLVWNNITELSRNIKTYLVRVNSDAKLITTCYWLDAPEVGQEKVDRSISYDWRQFDGFECSDLALFTCASTANVWKINASAKFKHAYINKILMKGKIWDFGYSEEELHSHIENIESEKKTILFLNRLSGINYTHHEEFIEALHLLKEMREDDWQVVMTNPSQKFSVKELKERVPNLWLYEDGKSLNRKQYANLLMIGDISVHLFEKELYGGCSNVEALAMNNICIMPKINEYKKRAKRRYPGFIKKVEPKEIALTLNKVLNMIDKNSGKLNKHIKYSKNYVYRNSSFEVISKKVVEDIESLWE